MAGRKKVAKPGRPITHEDLMKAAVRPDAGMQRRSQLLWENRSRATRGPRAAFTPDDVVRAAMEIADEEGGLGAVTMQAVSARLGLTTMAVYRYFPNKEALYDAIIDAGMGRPPQPPDPPEGWRAEVIRWAHAKRDCCVRGRGWRDSLLSPRRTARTGWPGWRRWRRLCRAPGSAANHSARCSASSTATPEERPTRRSPSRAHDPADHRATVGRGRRG